MARQLYPDIGDCRALVIDGNPTSRSVLTAMLRDMGVGQVAQASRALDARRSLEHGRYDIVLCDYHFEQSPMSGQDLLDDLRRAQLLPYATVFVMVTGEASYARVAEAAEAALDSYLLKPHTAAALEQRVLQARHRKQVLGSIFQAIEDGEFERAAALCQARFERRDEYWLYAARIGAELWLRLGRHAPAQALYEAVQSVNALPWARLGIARVELETGRLPQACRTLESLIAEQPAYADAYDVMGRAQVEQGRLDAALATYRTATRMTPTSVVRLQKQGTLAFHMGAADEAVDALERAVRVGIGSKMFDPQGLVLLAMLQFDRRDAKAFAATVGHLERSAQRLGDSMRLRRFLQTTGVLQALLARQVNAALTAARQLAAQGRDEDFDVEAAANLLAVLARMSATEIELPDGPAWVQAVAQRFCASRASTELLILSARHHPPYQGLVRQGQQHIAGLAEKAMLHSVGGEPGAAVQALISHGRETLNVRLIDMARLVLHRHADELSGREALDEAIADLRRRYCSQGTQVALGAPQARAAGALSLRS